MKKTISALCALLLCLCCALPAQAYALKVVDHALYTDIVAKIDGHPIRSYNIRGYTAVVAEDLRGYGFWVLWNAADRTLRISRALKDGEPETPTSWPVCETAPLTHRIGARAKPVYATDIVTSAAGSRIESFNINGETLVWIDDLAPFGSVVWHPEEREITLTLGDPVQLALAPLIADLEAWRAAGGSGSSYETYPCQTGTLLVTRHTGTPHGSSVRMLFVRKNGDRVSINDLLPAWPLGSASYLSPSEIAFDEPGHRLSFLTPVLETSNGDVRGLGVCKCTMDVLNGTLLSLEPLSDGLTDWGLTLSAAGDAELGQSLLLTVKRSGAEVTAVGRTFPGSALDVSLDAYGVRIAHYAALWDGAFEASAYHAAYEALAALGLPDITLGGGRMNTAEQRAAAARYVRLTLNGTPVSGDLFWSQGNNHRDLYFAPDSPLALRDGDTLALSVGVLP